MEEWRTVVTDNGEIWDNYEVSTEGRVRNVKTGRIKKQTVANRYKQVYLSKNGKGRNFRVNRLVAFAFIPNDDVENKTQVNHINEDKLDNRVENLEWVSPKQNQNHGSCSERKGKSRGKKVRCVETGQEFYSIREVQRQLGLPFQNVAKCCKNGHRCGGFHWEYVED